MVCAYFAQHTAVDESLYVFVYPGQRDRRDLFLYVIVDRFWAGMSMERHDGFIDNLPLVSCDQVVALAELAKLGREFHR